MKFTVINGSPKGDLSITLHYMLYLEKKFPNIELNILNIAQQIKKIENNQDKFDEIINTIKSTDAIIWAFPLYFLMVHSNLKRFIELIYERNIDDIFRNKYTAAISTSIHFFDHTAHNYIHAICDDLDMKYLGFYSAGMRDLLDKTKRKQIEQFMTNVITGIEKKIPTSKYYFKMVETPFEYQPGEKTFEKLIKIDTKGKKLLIISDIEENKQINLTRMISQFKQSFSEEIEEINLRNLRFKGGCLGCLHCSYDNQCVYIGKDDFIDFYDNKVKNADILIFAGELKDRYLSSHWKMFFDRSFYNTHIPVLSGKQIGIIISGPLSQNSNLREIFMGWFETSKANLIDFVTDEYHDSDKIDNLLNSMAMKSIQFSTNNYQNQITMRGFGGKKIFRDEIWGGLRFPFRADYVYFKKHNLFDFPQKKRKMRYGANVMLLLSKMKRFRQVVNKVMKNQMVKPFQDLLKKID